MKKCIWFFLLGVFLSYFISPALPIEWGWENGTLEWLQIFILMFGLLLNLMWWQRAKLVKNLPVARFLLWATPLWLVIIGLELNWGVTFYPVSTDAVNGPSFIDLYQISYGPFVYPSLAVLFIIWLYMGIKHKLYEIPYERLRGRKFPITILLITVLSFVSAGMGHILYLENMEKLYQCFAYLGLILLVYSVIKWVDYVIMQIQTSDEIQKVLYGFDKVFNPALSEIVSDLDAYAKKLQRNAIVYVAKDDIENLGLIAFYANDRNTRNAYLTQLAVQSNGQKKKIGQTLLELCIADAKSKGMTEITLEVYNHNDAAIRFYAKNGFEFWNEATLNSSYMKRGL